MYLHHGGGFNLSDLSKKYVISNQHSEFHKAMNIFKVRFQQGERFHQTNEFHQDDEFQQYAELHQSKSSLEVN